MPRASLRLLGNDSLIDKRMDYVRYVLPDLSSTNIPAYKGADTSDTTATWVVAGLLSGLLILLLELVVWNAHKNGWNKPDYIQVGNPAPMLQPSIYDDTLT
jgi:hypothetical protein